MMELRDTPHRRYNPLTREWVLVSPQRTERPWQGKVHETPREVQPAYDPNCYLCPVNARAAGVRNPSYNTTLVFDNDFPALLPSVPDTHLDLGGLIVAHPEQGICRVLCFDPRHDLTIASMNLQQVRRVVDVWIQQYNELGSIPWINHVQIFENRGSMMGASNPHPHCHIWATANLPTQPFREQQSLEHYAKKQGACTRITVRLCCALPRCRNSWLDTRCWVHRSAISRLKLPPAGCERQQKQAPNSSK